MQPLSRAELQEVYVAIGGAIYKIITSNAGRLSIPNIISIEWR